MTLAIEFYRSVTRYLASRAVASRAPGLLAGPVAPLRLVQREDRGLPGPDWVRLKTRLSGICGSDLGTIAGHSSFYFSALTSLPFVPGHEVVAEVIEGNNVGERVVIDPILGCSARGIATPCDRCSEGNHGLCERVTGGHVSAGLQTGYCKDTGGGWGESFVAHVSQLHKIPESMSDETAVMIEPLACAVHAVIRAGIADDSNVLICGAGTVGLLTLIALREFARPARITMVAKHSHQAMLALHYGASDVVTPDEAIGKIRRSTRAFRLDPERSSPFLLGGVDIAFDCAGSRSSLDLALRMTKARGRVVMSGMPQRADLSPAWFRELQVVGAYSGAGAFDQAVTLAQEAEVGKLVSASYPLSRWREAIDHATTSGSLGATKIAFDPRLD